jgi:flagellin
LFGQTEEYPPVPVSIVANLSSSYAQQAMRTRSDAMARDTQQLSSGQRVFSAEEDAAALAVGANLKTTNAGLASAQINVGTGTSMLQIADGALGQLADILTRMKALAIQASSGNLGDNARSSIDLEFQALKNEVDRISGATQFNGVHMLQGQPGFAIDSGADYSADGISAVGFNVNGLSADAAFRYTYDATTEQLTLTRVDQGAATSQTLDLTALMDATAGVGNNLGSGQSVPLNFNALGVTLTLGPSFDRSADILPTVTDNSGADIAVTTPAFAPATTSVDDDGVLGLQALGGGTYSATSGDLTLPIISDGTAVTLGAVAGISYAVNGGAAGASGAASADLVGANSYVDVYVDKPGGGTELLGRLSAAAIATGGTTGGSLVLNVGQGLLAANLQAASAGTNLTYKIGNGVISGQDLITVTIPPVNVASLSLTTESVTSQANANAAITALGLALTTVSDARATVGAQQARMAQASQNINLYMDNNDSARSALLDDDVPATITNLANDQAMMQVGVSMLSQSNQLPQILLQLLQNS